MFASPSFTMLKVFPSNLDDVMFPPTIPVLLTVILLSLSPNAVVKPLVTVPNSITADKNREVSDFNIFLLFIAVLRY